MKEVFQSILRMFRFNGLSLFVFDLVYRGTMVLFFVSGLNVLFDLAMDWMGYSYVTLGNLGDFLLNPFVIAIILAAVAGLLFLTVLELSALFYSYEYSLSGVKLSPISMLVLGWQRILRLRKKIGWWNLFWILCLVPFLYHPIIMVLLYRYGVLGQVFSVAFSGIQSILLTILLIVSIFVSGVFSLFLLPCMIMEESSMTARKNQIKKRFRRYFKRGSIYLILWNSVLLIFQFVGYVTLVFCMGVILKFQMQEQNYLYVRALEGHSWILAGNLILSGFLCFLMNSALIFQFYVRIRRREEPGKEIGFLPSDPMGALPKKKAVLVRVLVTVLLIGEAYFAISYISDSSLIAFFPFESVLVTAHRGSSIDAPENTLRALNSAMDQMADYAEIDVQMTADEVVVLLHDVSLLRTCGMEETVYNLTYSELRELDAGSYMGEEFNGEKIPLLAEVLEECKGRINLNIELKTHSAYRDKLAGEVVRLIEYYDMEDQCVISSMNYNYLTEVKGFNDRIRTGYIVRNLYGSFSRLEAADFISIKYTGISSGFVERAHRAGKEVWCWTINSPSEVKKMCSYKVDNIITDNPAMVRSLIAQDTYSLDMMDLFRMLIFTE